MKRTYFALLFFVFLASCGSSLFEINLDPTNTIPTADAGYSEIGRVGRTSTLDGTQSSDSDGDTLTYSWSIDSAPVSSTATLSNYNSSAPSITPDIVGTFTISLIVNDGTSDSSASSIELTALRNREMGELLVFYGWPSSINGSDGDVDLAVIEFKKYDYIVLGASLELTAHEDHANTVSIINNSEMDDTLVFGYIDLGVTTDNHPMSEIKDRIDKWKTTGADGIFLDDFGYDYQTSRSRQNEAVDYIHSVGLLLIANAFDPDDVFGNAVDATYNPGGVAHHMLATDYYLYESYQIMTGNYINPSLDWFNKMAKLRGYQASIPFKVLGVTTDDVANIFDVSKFEYGYYSALLDGLEAFGRGDDSYSSGDSVAPYRTRPVVNPGNYTGDVTYDGWQDCDGAGSGNWCHLYLRTTENGTIYLKSNDLFDYSFL